MLVSNKKGNKHLLLVYGFSTEGWILRLMYTLKSSLCILNWLLLVQRVIFADKSHLFWCRLNIIYCLIKGHNIFRDDWKVYKWERGKSIYCWRNDIRFMTLLHNSLQSFPFILNFALYSTEQFFHVHLRITNYNMNNTNLSRLYALIILTLFQFHFDWLERIDKLRSIYAPQNM